ncbi:type IV secretion system protein [Paracraurococcus lichenis]|uniref:Type IV secretion system protein n=1 Tax=Paracraurococcus lichenis TaxID=3064888 RepID=A0ABT9E884_9PROT|nr:type IV secretion system protein [Paracraurococcus sp. LOR1-02]MDO9712351.1 type IV secretion system protein [Paracraurococcus sp. LOR1-02]
MTHPAFRRGPLAAFVLSSAACATLASGLAGAAGIPVVDVALNALVGKEAAETTARWITQGAQMAKTITQGTAIIRNGVEQVNQGVQLYHNFTDPTYLQNFAMSLVRANVRAPLPGDSNQVRDALAGALGFDPASFQLSGLMNDFLQRNLVYRPEGDDPDAVRLREEASSNAAQLAMTQQGYEGNARRIDGLGELAGQIGKQATTAERADLNNRLLAEVAFAQTQANQLKALEMTNQAEQERRKQQDEQRNRKSAEDMVREADAVLARRRARYIPVTASLIP